MIKNLYNSVILNDIVERNNLLNKVIQFIIDDFGNRKYIQVSDYLSSDNVVDREFGAYNYVFDNYPKYVITMDKIDYSRNGIIHLNIIDFLIGNKDI